MFPREREPLWAKVVSKYSMEWEQMDGILIKALEPLCTALRSTYWHYSNLGSFLKVDVGNGGLLAFELIAESLIRFKR